MDASYNCPLHSPRQSSCFARLLKPRCQRCFRLSRPPLIDYQIVITRAESLDGWDGGCLRLEKIVRFDRSWLNDLEDDKRLVMRAYGL